MRLIQNTFALTAFRVWELQAYAYGLLLALNTAFIAILWESCGR